MKKKWLSKLSVLMLSAVLLVGCTSDIAEAPVETPKKEVVSETENEFVNVGINIVIQDEKVEELSHEYEVVYGYKLMDIMKEHYRLVEEDGFIKCIEGNGQDEEEGLYWVYDVNGEMGEVGAAEYELQEGDVIDWKLMSFE